MDHVHWIVWLPLVAACGASAPKTTSTPGAPGATAAQTEQLAPVHKRGEKKLIASVGPAGGTLSLDNGARLDIPAGALASEVEITLAEGAHTTAFSNRDYERPIGPVLEVAPALSLESPARISIPLGVLPEGFDEKDLTLGLEVVSRTQRAVPGQGVQTQWDYVEASAERDRATAKLDQVPGFRMQFVVSKSE